MNEINDTFVNIKHVSSVLFCFDVKLVFCELKGCQLFSTCNLLYARVMNLILLAGVKFFLILFEK